SGLLCGYSCHLLVGMLEELDGFSSSIKPTMFWRSRGVHSTYPSAVAALSMRYDATRASEIAVASTSGADIRAYLRNWDNDNEEWYDPVELTHSGNLRSSTGGSESFPMSQEAGTDALGSKVAEDAGEGASANG